MHEYAHWQTAMLLRRLAKEASKTARASGEEAIHDLRVAIRRTRGCLRLFAQFYPDRGRKELNRQLKKLMDACGAVRDRDIALRLLTEAGVPAASSVVRRLTEQRKEASRSLRGALKPWRGAHPTRVWRTRLEL